MDMNRDKPIKDLPPGNYSMVIDEDGTVSCTLEQAASEDYPESLLHGKTWTESELQILRARQRELERELLKPDGYVKCVPGWWEERIVTNKHGSVYS